LEESLEKMGKIRIFNRIITKGNVTGYVACVGCISQIVVPKRWVKKEGIRFNRYVFADHNY